MRDLDEVPQWSDGPSDVVLAENIQSLVQPFRPECLHRHLKDSSSRALGAVLLPDDSLRHRSVEREALDTMVQVHDVLADNGAVLLVGQTEFCNLRSDCVQVAHEFKPHAWFDEELPLVCKAAIRLLEVVCVDEVILELDARVIERNLQVAAEERVELAHGICRCGLVLDEHASVARFHCRLRSDAARLFACLFEGRPLLPHVGEGISVAGEVGQHARGVLHSSLLQSLPHSL